MNARKLLSAAKAVEAAYIEDVFSTYLYTGNGSTQTITNGIDLSGKGGLVWLKRRPNVDSHILTDSARGFGTTAPRLATDSTSVSLGTLDISAQSSGFILTGGGGSFNSSGETYVSWTFRKQAKFFDVVTYTGNGTNNRAIAHSLGSAPGCVIIKSTSNAQNWPVFHRSTGANTIFWLNATNANTSNTGYFPTVPDSTSFYVGTDTDVNQSGYTYVAYLFAHDAGGFGASGSDNVISCGSYTGNGSATGPTVTLGYEPQWLLIKRATGAAGRWLLMDSMRGFVVGGTDNLLEPQDAAAENGGYGAGNWVDPTATGFNIVTSTGGFNANGDTYIYIAIRRGPMKTPTTGTSVFSPQYNASGATGVQITTSFPIDMQMQGFNGGDGYNFSTHDRLRGVSTNTTQFTNQLLTSSTAAQAAPNSTMTNYWSNIGFLKPQYYNGIAYTSWNFRRAPGFFDEVCYTGVGAGTSFTHNLGVTPELIIIKLRSSPASNTAGWFTYHSALGTGFNLLLNTNAGSASTTAWNTISSTTVSFTGGVGPVSSNGDSYVAYLFATVAGVSKVFSYTGNGSSQTINCGFTGGARFVLIKRTDSTGDWYVWDSARGIVAGNDPHLSLNSTAAEVTTDDSVDTDSTGFVVNQLAATNVNVNAATYIGLAIA